MKKRMLMVLMVFRKAAAFELAFQQVLAVVSIVSADDTSSDCGLFCKVGKWWNEFRGEESLAEKVGR